MPQHARTPATADDWRWPLVLILVVTAWRLLIAGAVPVTQDEAYYFNWAQSLAWGYFDHPPGVALLGIGSWIAPGSAFAARLGAIIAGTLTLLILWRFYRACGLTRGRDLLLAMVLAAGTVPGMISGVITTPDTVLALCWALALHEALAALQGSRRRWLTAGLATGLGLLGKYTMVVIGPVFLWAILLADPRALRTPWPYLGGLLALLLFLPNIAWNANNDWLTMRFQFGHGFSADTGSVVLAADSLPAATGPMAYSPPQTGPMTPADRLASLGGYLGSQLAFWGLLLLPLGATAFVGGGLNRIRQGITCVAFGTSRHLAHGWNTGTADAVRRRVADQRRGGELVGPVPGLRGTRCRHHATTARTLGHRRRGHQPAAGQHLRLSCRHRAAAAT